MHLKTEFDLSPSINFLQYWSFLLLREVTVEITDSPERIIASKSLLETSHKSNLAPKLYFLNKLESKLALEFLERENTVSFSKYPRIRSVIEIILYCIFCTVNLLKQKVLLLYWEFI